MGGIVVGCNVVVGTVRGIFVVVMNGLKVFIIFGVVFTGGIVTG